MSWQFIVVIFGICVAGCSPEPPPPQPVAVPMVLHPPVAPVRRTAGSTTQAQSPSSAPNAPGIPGDDPTPTVAILSPKQIVTAAGQAKQDADGYVGWKDSKADLIDRLLVLVNNLDDAVAVMKRNETNGSYQAVDVVRARSALRQLRVFLSTKGD